MSQDFKLTLQTEAVLDNIYMLVRKTWYVQNTTLKEATTNCLKATIKKTEMLFWVAFVQSAIQKCVTM